MNNFSQFISDTGVEPDRSSIAAMLLLGDHLANRPIRTSEEYGRIAVHVQRTYGYGLTAACLLAAGWLEDPMYTPPAVPKVIPQLGRDGHPGRLAAR